MKKTYILLGVFILLAASWALALTIIWQPEGMKERIIFGDDKCSIETTGGITASFEGEYCNLLKEYAISKDMADNQSDIEKLRKEMEAINERIYNSGNN